MSDRNDLEETAQRLEAIIEHWFFELFHGSVVARSTETWNHVHRAKDDLKRRLTDVLANGFRD